MFGQLGAVDHHLAGRVWIVGDAFTLADVAVRPWISNLVASRGTGGIAGFAEVRRNPAPFLARPAVPYGREVQPPAG